MEKQTFKLYVYSIIQRQKHTNIFASICEDKQTGDATICEEKVKKMERVRIRQQPAYFGGIWMDSLLKTFFTSDLEEIGGNSHPNFWQ